MRTKSRIYSPIHTSSRGNTLLITVVALFLITMLTIGALTITTTALRTNQQQISRAIALNAAESGAERAALYLKACSSIPTSKFDPFGGQQQLDTATYQVYISPAVGNSTSFLKKFTIVSTGTTCGISKRVEIVLRQASFGRYAYFTDSETSNVSGGAIWWAAGEVVDGPVHSNNKNGSNFNINYNGSTGPIFLDTVTGSGNTINYQPGRPRNETTFRRIFAEGSKGYKLGVDPIPLPESTDAQKNAAWGSPAGFPTTTGVYLKSDVSGGIYIAGDAQIQLQLDSSGNQQICITQVVSKKTKVTTITLNKSTNSASVTGPVGSGSVTSGSMPNGMIYCSGNITSLSGTVADNRVESGKITIPSSLTIAADTNAGKNITITDNIVYNTEPDKTLDADDPVNLAAGTLGLVANNIKVSSSAPSNLTIDAVCMAGGANTYGGSFYVENYDSKWPTGKLTVNGGIIQKARGAVGTFNSSTGQTSTGYAKNYHYDPRLAINPPPFYPTTGQYERISWRVLPDND